LLTAKPCSSCSQFPKIQNIAIHRNLETKRNPLLLIQSKLKKMMLSNVVTNLPADFVPSEQHIIIGRGRLTKLHPGNRKFDMMVETTAMEYAAAPCKAEKGSILTRMVDEIHEAAPDAGFVRKDPSTGQWTLVEEALARQTAAQAIRNALSHSYRSSKQFKSKRRLQQIAAAAEQQQQHVPAECTFWAPMSQSPRCISPSQSIVSSQESSSLGNNFQIDIDATDEKTFSTLMAAFGNNFTPNPFEPRPLA
jgi:hypothetical protein